MWLQFRIFIVKLLYLYLALLSWIGIIIMVASIILIPLFVYLLVNVDWFNEPFEHAVDLGDDYDFYATRKWEEKIEKRIKK